MAHITNPRKNFNFTLQIAPNVINPWLFQKVVLPDIELDDVPHGDSNYDVKTAGRKKIGSMTIEKLCVSDSSDTYMYDWQETCQSQLLGGGAPPSVYKRVITISELAEDGVTVLNTWTGLGIWPKKVAGVTFDRLTSENVIESIELSCDEFFKV